MKKITVIVAVLSSLALWSCDKSKKICGVYVCKEHYDVNLINELKLDINIDGTVKLVGEKIDWNGTYQAFGDSIFITTDVYDMRLLIDKNNLVGYKVLFLKAGL